MKINCITYHKASIIVTEINKNELSKIDLAICQQPRETLKHFYNRQKNRPDVVINAGFFNMGDGSPVFDIIDEGNIVCDNPNINWGFGIKGDKDLFFGAMNDFGWRDFIHAYPTLINNKRKTNITVGKELDYKARRTILAYNEEKILIFSVDKGGLNFSDSQDLLMKYNVLFGINLDGGGSTELLINGTKKTSNLTSRPVDNVLCFYLKDEENTYINDHILYRVQLGAFSYAANAYELLDKVKKLGKSKVGIDYSKAFVTFDETLYRVQVGAFKDIKNAQRVEADLKKKGFDCFIKKIKMK